MPPFLNVYFILDGGGASANLNTAKFHINIQRVKTCMTSDAHHSTSLIDVMLFFSRIILQAMLACIVN